jgi:hypothetical protein
MYLGTDFPNFFLPLGRVFGAEIPVTKRGKPNGSVLMTGQFKRMTPELEHEIAGLLADMLVKDYLAQPPDQRATNAPPLAKGPSPQEKANRKKRRKGE